MLCKHCSAKPKCSWVINAVLSETGPSQAALCTTARAGVSHPLSSRSRGTTKYDHWPSKNVSIMHSKDWQRLHRNAFLSNLSDTGSSRKAPPGWLVLPCPDLNKQLSNRGYRHLCETAEYRHQSCLGSCWSARAFRLRLLCALHKAKKVNLCVHF